MPVVKIDMYKGRPIEKKRKLVKAVTDAIVSSLGVKPEVITIIINENEKENWASAGTLDSDKTF